MEHEGRRRNGKDNLEKWTGPSFCSVPKSNRMQGDMAENCHKVIKDAPKADQFTDKVSEVDTHDIFHVVKRCLADIFPCIRLFIRHT